RVSWVGVLRSFSARLAYSWQRPTKHDPYDAPESIASKATRPRAAQLTSHLVEHLRRFRFVFGCHNITSMHLHNSVDPSCSLRVAALRADAQSRDWPWLYQDAAPRRQLAVYLAISHDSC